jgi:hypothetical protein
LAIATEKQNNLQKITTDYRSGKVLVFFLNTETLLGLTPTGKTGFLAGTVDGKAKKGCGAGKR